jgi:hypothetical protein
VVRDGEGYGVQSCFVRGVGELAAELLALIRDAGIDSAQLCAILELNPETLPAGDDNPHPPIQ